MKLLKLGMLAILLGTLLGACNGGKTTKPDGDSTTAGSQTQGSEGQGADLGSGIDSSQLDAEQQDLLSKRVIYFEFDSSVVKEEYVEVLKAHAQYLSEHPGTKVILEGHTDKRGSREYNIALGERRAQAVEKLLLLQGVSPSQIQIISFGEERPAAFADDEESYSLNRRVEILYSEHR
jgi:peptidoglycan-associated lipoprotein